MTNNELKQKFLSLTCNKLSKDIKDKLKVFKVNTPSMVADIFKINGVWPSDEWPEHKAGYRVIPRYPRYSVSEDGKVYDSVKRKLLTHTVTGTTDYPKVALVKPWYIDLGGSMTQNVGVHILIASCWVANKDWSKNYLVRHLDNDKRNLAKGNLIWGTHKTNGLDAAEAGSVAGSVAVVLYDMVSKTKTIYASIGILCVKNDFNKNSVYTTFQQKPYGIYLRRYQLRQLGDPTPFVDKVTTPGKHGVHIYNHSGHTIGEYDTVCQAAMAHGVSQGLITKLLSEGPLAVRFDLSARCGSIDSVWEGAWVYKESARNFKIEVTYPCGKTKVFNSLREADDNLPINRKFIGIALKLNKAYKGYKFKKLESNN